jgi:nitric oxide reductase activation protein
MGGDKWRNTQIAVVAIAKACSMIQNVDVVISYRSTHHTSRRRGSSFPLMLIAYDSRVDKFSKIKNDFWRIKPAGTTPEGLCFEAVYKEIEPSTKDKDSYFLNFSDGMPMFSNDNVEYFNNNAIKHTRKMVDMIRGRGVKVLSYFIGDSWEREQADSTFTQMYGKDSQFIDVTSVLPVAKSMNKKFLEK